MEQYDEIDLPGEQRANGKVQNKPGLDSYDSPSNVHHNGNGNMPYKHVKDENNMVVDDEMLLNEESSLMIFTEEYDGLDDTDYPHPDPAADPDFMDKGKRNLSGLDSMDFPILHQSKSKAKVKVRSITNTAHISSRHTTYFPTKITPEQAELFKKKVIPDSSFHYDMDTFPRGTFVLFNVEHFLPKTRLAECPRKGTERDADGLCALFLELGFIVERYDNPSKKVMLSALDSAAYDTSKLSCCACAVLTHGEEGIVYAIDDSVKVKTLARRFRTKALAGKPKIFLFQACQGSDYMDSVVDVVDGLEKEDVLSLPSEVDFFYAYSTVPGYYSWRNNLMGSWFMQSLCKVFRRNAHSMDLYRMLTRVNDDVSERKSRTDVKATDDKRQIAALVSQLRKELFFFPPYGPLVAL